MKRSRSIRLVLIGGAGLVSLTACDDATDAALKGQLFTDAQACEAAFDKQECLDAYRRAEAEHVQTAPKFASRSECEAQYGAQNCTAGPPPETAQANAGGSWFMPAMMGFMMGRMMGGGVAAAPVYRDTQNTAYTGNRTVGRLDSARMPPPRAIAGTPGVPRQAARGGFGRSGYSGGG